MHFGTLIAISCLKAMVKADYYCSPINFERQKCRFSENFDRKLSYKKSEGANGEQRRIAFD